jgi:hypothetical protein
LRPPSQRGPIVGLLLSIGLGIALAVVVAIPVVFGGGRFKEGSYCSPAGIGEDPPINGQGAGLAYLSGDWGGFPPRRECRVYAIDRPKSRDLGVVTNRDAIAAYPHRLVAEGSYPQPGDYTWVLVALLLPPGLWALYSVAALFRSRRQS